MPEILKGLEYQRNNEAIEFQERQLLNQLKSGDISSDEYISRIEELKNQS